MHIPVQVTFCDLPVSEDMEAACWNEADELDALSSLISSCRVFISRQGPAAAKNPSVEVLVDVVIAGHEFLCSARSRKDDPGSVVLAIHDAFARARRRIARQRDQFRSRKRR